MAWCHALGQSGIVRSDLRSRFGTSSGTAQGAPMALELTVADLANGGAPSAGVAVPGGPARGCPDTARACRQPVPVP